MKKQFLLCLFFMHLFCGLGVAAPFFSDDFESGNLRHVENGASWTASNSSSADSVSITRERAHSGSHSLKFFHAGSSNLSDDAWTEQRFDLGDRFDDIYIRYYIYFSSNYSIRNASSSDNTKLMYLWGDSYRDDMNKIGVEYETDMHFAFKGKVAGYPRTLSCSGATGYVSALSRASTSISSLRGRWVAIEIHARRDTGSGNGIFQLWIDGDLEINAQNLAWAGAPCGRNMYFKNGYLMGWSNSGFNEDTTVYIDDVVFSDSYIGLNGAPPPPQPSRPATPKGFKRGE